MDLWFECGPYQLIIDQDDSVAYAFLVDQKGEEMKIGGFVWLYNVGAPPFVAPWTLGPPGENGYQNSIEYMKDEPFSLPETSDFSTFWDSTEQNATIYIRDELHAVVWIGAAPGNCRLARKPSPAANPLTQ